MLSYAILAQLRGKQQGQMVCEGGWTLVCMMVTWSVLSAPSDYTWFSATADEPPIAPTPLKLSASMAADDQAAWLAWSSSFPLRSMPRE